MYSISQLPSLCLDGNETFSLVFEFLLQLVNTATMISQTSMHSVLIFDQFFLCKIVDMFRIKPVPLMYSILNVWIKLVDAVDNPKAFLGLGKIGVVVKTKSVVLFRLEEDVFNS